MGTYIGAPSGSGSSSVRATEAPRWLAERMAGPPPQAAQALAADQKPTAAYKPKRQQDPGKPATKGGSR